MRVMFVDIASGDFFYFRRGITEAHKFLLSTKRCATTGLADLESRNESRALSPQSSFRLASVLAGFSETSRARVMTVSINSNSISVMGRFIVDPCVGRDVRHHNPLVFRSAAHSMLSGFLRTTDYKCVLENQPHRSIRVDTSRASAIVIEYRLGQSASRRMGPLQHLDNSRGRSWPALRH